MKLQFYTIAMTVVVTVVAASGSSGLNLRRAAEQSHRRLPHPHPHSGGGSGGSSDYYGCLELNSTEQAQVWPDGPSCDYGSGSDGGNSGNDSSGNDSGGSDTATGNGDSSGNDDDTVTQYEVVDDDTTSNNPYDDFVITKCDTYESLWRWDLHMSCGGDSSNLASCNCTFAEELFDKGLLVCEDRERCPRNCPICSTCLSVLGCPETAGPVDRLATSTMIYIIVGVVILLVVALAVFHSRRRRQQQHELKKHLISEEDEYDTDGINAGVTGGFEPPNGVAGGALVAGGAAAWKAPKETDSEADTDDCTRSVDATVPTVGESSATPFMAMAATGIATVRSEEEDAGPEDENEATKNADTQDEMQTTKTESPTMESTSADVGAVRDAFLQSLEADGDVEDQQTDSSFGALGEGEMERKSSSGEPIESPDQEQEQEQEFQPSENKIVSGDDDADQASDVVAAKSSDVAQTATDHAQDTPIKNDDESMNLED